MISKSEDKGLCGKIIRLLYSQRVFLEKKNITVKLTKLLTLNGY